MLGWDDHHLILTLARAGTVAGAARRLGVNETTVARRLAAVEAAAGATVFQRIERKLTPTGFGRAIVEAARAMELALANSGQEGNDLRGIVRVSAVAAVVEYLVAPNLPDFTHRHPGLVLELIASNETASLARRETDIAIRLERPRRGRLVARRLGRIRFRLAATVATQPSGFMAYDRDLDTLPEIRAIAEHFGGAPVARLATLSGLRAAAEAGVGAAMLPDWMIEASPHLRILHPDVVAERPLWLVVHEDLKDRPGVRAALDWLAETITGRPDALSSRERVSVAAAPS